MDADHDHDALVARFGECIRCLSEKPPDPPPRRTGAGGAACEFCARPVQPLSVGTYRRISGWTGTRRQGGTNAIRLRTEEHRYACGRCIDRLSKGQPTGPDLLDMTEGTTS